MLNFIITITSLFFLYRSYNKDKTVKYHIFYSIQNQKYLRLKKHKLKPNNFNTIDNVVESE